MTKTLKIILGVLIIIIACFLYNNFFNQGMIVGTYVNQNYRNSTIGPNVADTIVLLDNGTFDNSYWGLGKYTLSYSFKGTRILIDYDDDMATDFNTSIGRIWFGKPEIIFDSDLSHYYYKN